ncbi:MAG: DUF169 domain-containing protein [Methanomicrobiales archaeon]|nr:DUF169 domain-containing protein [Methanomicrobiales archaeon]
MTDHSYRKISERFIEAFHLTTRPLAIYGTNSAPANVVHLSTVDRCFAVTLYRLATERDISAIYVGASKQEGCCLGGLTYMGFSPRPEYIRYFVSTGKPGVRGGAAEYLKSSPETVEACFATVGKITPPGKYLIVQACEDVPDPDPGVRAICVFGNAEQIRNIAALVHFDRDNPFSPVIVPWGPSCATFISYPAGMTEGAPKDTAFMGPQDPTQNRSLPPDTMALGIPASVMIRMAENLDRSFVMRRAKIAFPDHG